MSFFSKITKPSYQLTIQYDQHSQLYYYDLTIDRKSAAELHFENSLSEYDFSGSSKENPIQAFWHYNPSSLPGFIFSE